MTKPRLLQPRTVELFIGLAVVVLVGCVIVVRNGPSQSWAENSVVREEAANFVAAPITQREPHEEEGERRARRESVAVTVVPHDD